MTGIEQQEYRRNGRPKFKQPAARVRKLETIKAKVAT